MQLVHHGGAKLVIGIPGHQQFDAAADGGQVQRIEAGGPGVLIRAVLDVHGHVIGQALPQDRRQAVRMGAVGVQLRKKAHLPDFP